MHLCSANKEKKRPVMIHRAVLGSVERLTAILTESYAGKWPFWLSPRQAIIVTVHKSVDDYAKDVESKIFEAGFEVEFDEDSGETLNKRIRNAQLALYNYILVIGPAEKEHGTVNVRTREEQVPPINTPPIYIHSQPPAITLQYIADSWRSKCGSVVGELQKAPRRVHERLR